MTVALAGYIKQAVEFGQRIFVIIDAQIEDRVGLSAVDLEASGLPTTFITAGRFACAHGVKKPFGKW